MVHVLNQDCLTKIRSVVLSSTSITVSARSDLEIEGTVHSTVKTQKILLTYPLLYHTHGLSDQPLYVNLQVKRRQIFGVERRPRKGRIAKIVK